MIVDNFESKIKENIEELSISAEKVAVALSGGSDSLALTIALKNIGFDVLAILVNHHLRAEAGEEITETIKTLKKFKIDYIVKNWDGKYKKNLESEARNARYSLLLEVCKKENINTLCIGHHIDDQIETFLLNLARGSGLDGLCAMPKKNTIDGVNVIRPMLNLTKQNCRDYLIHLGVKWCEDESNKDIKYKRNKIRYLINQIEDKDILVKRIANTIEILQEVRETIDDLVNRMDKKIVKYDKNSAFFNKNDLLVLTKYLQKSLITKCILKLAGKEYKPRLYQIENIITSITDEKDFKRTIMNLIIKKKGDIIEIYKMKKI